MALFAPPNRRNSSTRTSLNVSGDLALDHAAATVVQLGEITRKLDNLTQHVQMCLSGLGATVTSEFAQMAAPGPNQLQQQHRQASKDLKDRLTGSLKGRTTETNQALGDVDDVNDPNAEVGPNEENSRGLKCAATANREIGSFGGSLGRSTDSHSASGSSEDSAKVKAIRIAHGIDGHHHSSSDGTSSASRGSGASASDRKSVDQVFDPHFEPARAEGNRKLSRWGEFVSHRRKRMSTRLSTAMQDFSKQRTRSSTTEEVWKFLEMPQSSKLAGRFHAFLNFFVACTLFLTFCQALEVRWLDPLEVWAIESGIDLIFLLEVIARLFACPSFATFFNNVHTLIDVMTAAPLGLRTVVFCTNRPLLIEPARLLTAVFLGLVPVLRLLKTLRHNTKFHLLTKAFYLAFEALPVLLFFYFGLWLFFSALIYAIEPSHNLPDLKSAMWLTVVSMTTVGYGDMAPVTQLGRITVSILVIASQMYLAIPLGILGSCFSQVWHDRDRHLLGHRVRGALQQHGFTVHDLPGLFEAFDTDHDGNLSFIDFKMMVDKLRLGLGDDRVLELYENVDDDNSGAINVGEFIKFLSPETYWQMYGAEEAKNRMRAVSGDLREYGDALNAQESEANDINEQSGEIS